VIFAARLSINPEMTLLRKTRPLRGIARGEKFYNKKEVKQKLLNPLNILGSGDRI